MRMRTSLLWLLCVSLGITSCGGGAGAKKHGVISMAPHITEVVYALGQGHQLIACGKFDDYPPEVLSLPKVGGYTDPDFEKIAALNPALILLPGAHPKMTEFANAAGIAVVNIHMDSLETIRAGIFALGQIFRCPERAEALVNQLNADLEAVRQRVEGRETPKVLLITSRERHDLNNLPTVGKSSFLSELVTVAGGRNVFEDQDQPYFEASKETVVMRAPDVIFEFHCGVSLTEAQRQAFYDDWKELSVLPAVQQARIFFITDSHGMRPGPRVAEIARKMGEYLHPEAFITP